jgi:hypothetical protein
MAAVHENCVRYTTLIDTTVDSASRFDDEFRNVFTAIDLSRKCEGCGRLGATITCSDPSCKLSYHFACAEELDWKFEKQGPKFSCMSHRRKHRKPDEQKQGSAGILGNGAPSGGIFQHALFSMSASDNPSSPHKASNLDMGGSTPFDESESVLLSSDSSDDDSEIEDVTVNIGDTIGELTHLIEGSALHESRLVRVHRPSVNEPWRIELNATLQPRMDKSALSVAACPSDPFDGQVGLQIGDIILAVNGAKVGSSGFDTLEKVMSQLGQEVDVMMEIGREL